MPRWYRDFITIEYIKNSKILPKIIYIKFLVICIDILKILIFGKIFKIYSTFNDIKRFYASFLVIMPHILVNMPYTAKWMAKFGFSAKNYLTAKAPENFKKLAIDFF